MESEQAVIENEEIKRLSMLLDIQEKKYDVFSKIKKDLAGINMDFTILFPN